MSPPDLSVVVVLGPCRDRAQRVLGSLKAQTVRETMEIVAVDLAPRSSPLELPATPPTERLVHPEIERWGRARAVGLRAARGRVVAFVEDHCYPASDWGAALLEAHEGPWATVGYVFTNANPGTYVSRASMLARYGAFAHPVVSGEGATVSGNNVSYKREVLLALGDDLDELLTIDFNVQQRLSRHGYRHWTESRALAAHENFERISLEGRTGRPYCRMLAAERVRSEGWGWGRRLLYAASTPLGAPALRLGRLGRSLIFRRELRRTFLVSVPAIAVEYLWDASGEAPGYLFGPGGAARETLRWELEEPRAGRRS